LAVERKDDINELAQRLRALEDEKAILATIHQFGHAMDGGEHERWVDCFTPDATYDVRVGAQSAATSDRSSSTTGAEALRAFAESRSPSPASVARHLVVEPVIEISGDEASATSYFVRIELFPGDPEPAPFVRSFGRYHDGLVRCDDGRWRIAHRRSEVDALTRSEGAPPVRG
jgi:hypothetical protein